MTSADPLLPLGDALDALASALATGRADAVLAAEASLAAATRAVVSMDLRAAAAGPAIGARAGDLRLVLERCRALGAVSTELVTALFPDLAYRRDGRPAIAAAALRLRSRS